MPSLSQRFRDATAAISSVLCFAYDHTTTDLSSSDHTLATTSHDEKPTTSMSTVTAVDIPPGDLSGFIKAHPQYSLTSPLDVLRQRDYTRLASTAEVYVDYMGGSLYPESLVGDHARLLQGHTFGNTHSISNR
jgi:hypothetical protein